MKFRVPLFAAMTLVAAFAAVAAHAETVDLPAGVFRMANGSYYRPSDGLITTDLSVFLGGVPSSVPTIPTNVTTTTPDVLSTVITAPAVPQMFPLKRAIVEGRAQLEELVRADAAKVAATKPLSKEPDTRKITLAIWNPATDVIRLVDAMKNGRSLEILTKDAGKISVVRSNGVNSEFAIGGGTNEAVVAIRYTIYNQIKKGKKSTYAPQEVVYTPYSKALHTPEMIALGEKWFDTTVSDVYAKLRADGVKSRATPGALLADSLDRNFIQSIILIEHLDESALNSNPKGQLETFFVTLAGNEDSSFNFSRSSAGALGLVQFIPSTYKGIVAWRNPSLTPDFETGMRDPENAVRAETAYLDYLLSRFPDETRLANANSPEKMEEMVAAAYNGGVTRVVKAITVWDENLDPSERLHVRTRSRLKLETMHYVLKLRALKKFGQPVTLALAGFGL